MKLTGSISVAKCISQNEIPSSKIGFNKEFYWLATKKSQDYVTNSEDFQSSLGSLSRENIKQVVITNFDVISHFDLRNT